MTPLEITKEEILKIADLAKLTVTSKEAEKLQTEIAGILDFVGKLQSVNVDDVTPTSHARPTVSYGRAGGIYNALREDDRGEADEANEGHPSRLGRPVSTRRRGGSEADQRDSIVGSFPDVKNDFLGVPPILPQT